MDAELPRALRGYEQGAVQARLTELAAERDRLTADLNEARAAVEALTAERDGLQAELREVRKLLDDVRAERERLWQDAEEYESRLAAVFAQQNRLATESNETRTLLQMRSSERDRSQAELVALREHAARLEARVQEADVRERTIQDSIAALNEFLATLLDRIWPAAVGAPTTPAPPAETLPPRPELPGRETDAERFPA